MDKQAVPAAIAASKILPIVTVALGVGVFILDAITHVEVAVAVLYVPVILMAGRFLRARGVVLVSCGCAALALLGHYLSPGDPWTTSAVLDRLIGLSALALTMFFVLKNQSTEIALRDQARLLDLTHDTIFVRDANDVITYWNRGAAELYGWTPEEAAGNATHMLLHTIFPEPLENIMETLRATDRWEGRLIHTKRDGTRVLVASRWSAQRNDRGQFVGTLETNNDTTERTRAEEELQETQAELARITRLTAMGQLAASIAHEINQPLTGVVTNGTTCLHWLEDENLHLDKARMAAQRMVRDGERASDVMRRIHALMTKSAPQTRDVDMNGVIDEVLALTQTELRSRQVSVRTELAATLPPVLGDRVQLQQVVLNLVINGMDAMALVTERPRLLLIGSRLDGGRDALIFVRDHGLGLDAETADKIFEAFFTTKPKGIGMGLAICRSIVEAHGGRLWASAASPHGAIFQFTLPTKDARNA